MKKLNTDCIDIMILKFFQDVNIECSFGLDTDFYYYYETGHIGYSLIVTERSARLYPEFVKANGLKYEVPIFILSLLHEVGHHYTLNLFDDEELLEYELQKDMLDEDNDECYIKYFSIPDEFEATMWAINFINTHPSEIKLLDLSLNRAMKEFIAVNNIESEE